MCNEVKKYRHSLERLEKANLNVNKQLDRLVSYIDGYLQALNDYSKEEWQKRRKLQIIKERLDSSKVVVEEEKVDIFFIKRLSAETTEVIKCNQFCAEKIMSALMLIIVQLLDQNVLKGEATQALLYAIAELAEAVDNYTS